MDNSEQKSKTCRRCGNFSGYYTKGLSRFERTKLGYCKILGKIVENSESCEKWCNGCASLRFYKKASLKALYGLLANISDIKQILEEVQEEENNNI